MSNFDEFVKENFSALHESCENGNFIAKMTKDSMLATWNEQQKKIDDAIKALEQSKPNMMCSTDALQALYILKGEELLK